MGWPQPKNVDLVGAMVWSVLVRSDKEADVFSALDDGEVDAVSGVGWLVSRHKFRWVVWYPVATYR